MRYINLRLTYLLTGSTRIAMAQYFANHQRSEPKSMSATHFTSHRLITGGDVGGRGRARDDRPTQSTLPSFLPRDDNTE